MSETLYMQIYILFYIRYSLYIYQLKYVFVAKVTCIKYFLPLSRKGKTNSDFHVIVFDLSS